MGSVGIAGRAVIAAIPLAVICGCAGNPVAPAPLPLGQPFELRLSLRAELEQNIFLSFTDVTSDSRCPIDAACVSAGEAFVSTVFVVGAPSTPPQSFGVTVFVNGLPIMDGVPVPVPWCISAASRVECKLSTSEGKSAVRAQGYTIRLIDLKPHPRAATPIERADYVGTFVVAPL